MVIFNREEIYEEQGLYLVRKTYGKRNGCF